MILLFVSIFKLSNKVINFILKICQKILNKLININNKIINKLLDYLKKKELNNIVKNELPTINELNFQKKFNFKFKPLISIIIPVYNPPLNLFKLTLKSAINQTYNNIEIIVVNASTDIQISNFLDLENKENDKIKIINVLENKGISDNLNIGIKNSNGDFIGFLDHDDELTANAIFEFVKVINEKQDVEFIYSDEFSSDAITNKVRWLHKKPCYSPYTLYGVNYICHFVLVEKKLLNKISGFSNDYPGSQDYDLFLKIFENTLNIEHIPKILYNWKFVKSSYSNSKIEVCVNSSLKALKDSFNRTKNPFLPLKIANNYTRYNIVNKKLNSNIETPVIFLLNFTNLKELKITINSIIEKSTFKFIKFIINTNLINNYNEKLFFNELNELIDEYDLKICFINNLEILINLLDNYSNIIIISLSINILVIDWYEKFNSFLLDKTVSIIGCKLININGLIYNNKIHFSNNEYNENVIINVEAIDNFICTRTILFKKYLVENVNKFELIDLKSFSKMYSKNSNVIFYPNVYHFKN